MSLRLLTNTVELVLAGTVAGWGITSAVRPDLWNRRPVRWWVGWTRDPVGRWEGVGVALAGAGIALSGIATALTTPTPAMPLPARVVQLAGLGLLVLAGALLAVVHPTGDADALGDEALEPGEHLGAPGEQDPLLVGVTPAAPV